jgi:hypothetical protein
MVENHDSTELSDGLASTAVCVAVGKGNLNIVYCLIDRGADVNLPFRI